MNRFEGTVYGEATVTPLAPVDGTVKRRRRGKGKSGPINVQTVEPLLLTDRPAARPGERWRIVSTTEMRTVYL